jgi:hypothetical protein
MKKKGATITLMEKQKRRDFIYKDKRKLNSHYLLANDTKKRLKI